VRVRAQPGPGLTCVPKSGGARNNKLLVTHPMSDQRCLTSAIVRQSALIAGPPSIRCIGDNRNNDTNILSISLCVIHKEGLCPSSGNINRLMMKMIYNVFGTYPIKPKPTHVKMHINQMSKSEINIPKKNFCFCMKKFSSR
jgi:hypothetical protein